MSRMFIDDEIWSRLEKLLPKPKGRHGKNDRLFNVSHWRDVCKYTISFKVEYS